jgi:hypothetical protein
MLHCFASRLSTSCRWLGAFSSSLALLASATGAKAQEPAAAPGAAPAAPAPPAPGEPLGVTPEPEVAPPAPPPYSLPFQLRPAAATTTLRLDTSFAFYDDAAGKSGFAAVPILSFSYKLFKGFAPIVRAGFIANSPADPAPSGSGFINPLVGATYALDLPPEFKLAFFLGFTIPVGLGGGDNPDPANKAARGIGLNARAAMDNALFAVDDFTVVPGVDFAFVKGGFTAQAEATLFQLTRVRGSHDPTTDSSRTNLTMGLHVGYFLIPAISLGAEIRHQRWLSTPIAVKANGAARDTTTVAVGPRFHFQVSKGKWLRPGIAFAFPLDDPMKKSSYKIVQLDIPFTF